MSIPPAPSRRLWQVAGALALAHVALMLAGFALTSVARLGAAPGSIVGVYRASSESAAGIGGAISLLGFLAFFLAVPVFARLLRGGTEGTRWLSAVLSAAGVLYVGLTFALPFAASSAARYEAHRGLPAGTVAALSDLRWFGVDTATVVLGVFTLAVAAGAWATRLLPRWVAVGGFLAGVACLVPAVGPPEDVVDDLTLLWMVWFVLLAVAALVAGRSSRPALSRQPAPGRTSPVS